MISKLTARVRVRFGLGDTPHGRLHWLFARTCRRYAATRQAFGALSEVMLPSLIGAGTISIVTVLFLNDRPMMTYYAFAVMIAVLAAGWWNAVKRYPLDRTTILLPLVTGFGASPIVHAMGWMGAGSWEDVHRFIPVMGYTFFVLTASFSYGGVAFVQWRTAKKHGVQYQMKFDGSALRS